MDNANSKNRKVFSVPVTIYATAYIIAENAESALEKSKKISDRSIEFPKNMTIGSFGSNDLILSGEEFDDPDLPEVSLSPVMTIGSPEGDHSNIEQAYPDA